MSKDKTERDPRVFEHAMNVYVVSVKQKRNDSKSEGRLNMEVQLQVVADKDFDATLDRLASEEFRKREISMHEVVEGIAAFTNSINFAPKFKDHAVTLRASSHTIAKLTDVELGSFQMRISDMRMLLTIKANDVSGEQIGKVSEVLQRNVRAEFKRAAHWSASNDQQKDLPLSDGKDEKTKAADTKAKVEKAKNVANKANTNKARGRKADTGKTNAALKKAAAKKKQAPKK